MANSPLTLHPPYLRYDNPSEYAQIQAKINALKARAAARHPTQTNDGQPTLAVSPNVLTVPENPRTGIQRSKDQLSAAITRAINIDAPQKLESQLAQPAMRGIARPAVELRAETPQGVLDSGSAAKTATPPVPVVNLTPQGNVPIGFNCKMTFHGTNNFQCPDVYWSIMFKNPATGQFDLGTQYLADASAPDEPTDEIDLEIDFSTYNLAAYQMANGTAVFKILCRGFVYTSNGTQLPSAAAESAPVTLNFQNNPPCLSVYSIDLSENTFVGGQNGQEPTISVTLDGPAPPSGQRINLSVSNNNLGEIMGSGYFVIPAGQTTGSLHWFLGTRGVLTNRTFDIIVRAEGSTYEGHAPIYVHKK